MDFSDFGRHFGNFGSMWDNFTQPSHYREYSPFAPPRQVPVRRPASPPPKVFSVPVKFFRPERDPSGPAVVKIQKAFRGFLARKSVRKIAEIKIEADEIERRISRKETVELIRREAKERLRLDEALMRLLERLDAVKGLDSGVREFRKTVTRKVIALQDRVDGAVSAAAAADGGGGGDETLEARGDSEWENWESISEIADGIGAVEMEKPQIDETLELQSDFPEAECEVTDQDKGIEASDNRNADGGECAMEIAKAEGRELLERVVEDNRKMMGMMAQLFERNEEQTRMLSSLANRVDQMERAMACERMMRRRKKKRNDGAGAGDFLVGRSPDCRGRRH